MGHLTLHRRPDSGGVGASLAMVAGCVVFPQQTDGKTLGPCGGVLLLGGQAGGYSEPADVREMLLKLILGSAFFHSSTF
jgi:hypothetical protein